MKQVGAIMEDDETFIGGVVPLTVQCSNGGVVHVHVTVVKECPCRKGLVLLKDILNFRQKITSQIIVEGG